MGKSLLEFVLEVGNLYSIQCFEADVIIRTRYIFLHILVYFSPYIFKNYMGNFHLIYQVNALTILDITVTSLLHVSA